MCLFQLSLIASLLDIRVYFSTCSGSLERRVQRFDCHLPYCFCHPIIIFCAYLEFSQLQYLIFNELNCIFHVLPYLLTILNYSLNYLVPCAIIIIGCTKKGTSFATSHILIVLHSFYTHYYLRVFLEIVVWIYDTFDIILEIKNGSTKDLKEGCWKCSEQHFPIKHFPN